MVDIGIFFATLFIVMVVCVVIVFLSRSDETRIKELEEENERLREWINKLILERDAQKRQIAELKGEPAEETVALNVVAESLRQYATLLEKEEDNDALRSE